MPLSTAKIGSIAKVPSKKLATKAAARAVNKLTPSQTERFFGAF